MANLKPVLSCLVSLFLVLTDVGAEENAYVVRKLYEDFSCVPLDSGGLCVGDIKVLNATATGYEQSIKLMNSSLHTFANKSCADAVIKSTCFGFPRCEPKKQYIDVETAVAQCEKAKSVCPELVIHAFLNCTEKRELYEQLNITRQSLECKVFNDSTGTCPAMNYKFADIPGVNYTESFLEAKNFLGMVKNNVTSDCYKTVKKAGCQLVGAVCSDDGEYLVSLLSKQQCTKAMKCLPEAMYSALAKDLCDNRPDENTAKKVPYPGRSPSTGVPTQPYTGVPTQNDTGVPTQPDTGVPTQPDTGVPTQPDTGVPTQNDTGVPKQNDTGAPTQPDSASFLAPTLEVVLPIIIFLTGLLVRA